MCFQGLSENHFAEYKDTYDGLLFAIDQLAANVPDQEEIVSLCRELLQYTLVQTQKETTFKKEIFFLPYKASMWDSLESVWKAADEDVEHCIAYVMPIPYADLTPEHTVAEWHCERELFPKDVPTVNWEDFDLQEIHPDVIFIHNPYDEYNRVTSVESRYYSSVLKNQTDKLVYIPYFVLDEIIPGNESAEEQISGFVLTPAVLNADEVIVQSEDMRQVYINVLLCNTDQKNRSYWEKHILGIGSPKIEKVLASKKEDFEIPAAWEKIVKERKIILYNTSLSAILQNMDKVCDKLRRVFDVFKKRDDVALWWRPHPLMKATIHSMCPQIEKEYCAIEDEYIRGGWGIYDDTSDLHRAITWSDAYYGDKSSIVGMYQKTGKPIMIQDLRMTDLKERALTPNAMISNGESIYCTERFSNGLYKIDFHSYKSCLIGKFLKSLEDDSFLCHCIVPYKNYLYFIPFNASVMSVFDYNDSSIDYIDLPDNITSNFFKFYHGTAVGNKIFLFGYAIDEILIYEIDTGCWVALNDCTRLFKEYINSSFSSGLYLHDSVIVENEIFVVSIFGNAILCINAADYSYSVIELNVEAKGYASINEYKGNLWLVPYADGNFVKYDIKKHEISVVYQDSAVGDWSYMGSIINENKLYAMPCYTAGHCLEIDMDTGKAVEIYSMEGKESAISTYMMSNKKIVACMPQKNKFIVYDTVSHHIEGRRLTVSDCPIKSIKGRFLETPIFPLEDFLRYEKWLLGTSEGRRNFGRIIYKTCLN